MVGFSVAAFLTRACGEAARAHPHGSSRRGKNDTLPPHSRVFTEFCRNRLPRVSGRRTAPGLRRALSENRTDVALRQNSRRACRPAVRPLLVFRGWHHAGCILPARRTGSFRWRHRHRRDRPARAGHGPGLCACASFARRGGQCALGCAAGVGGAGAWPCAASRAARGSRGRNERGGSCRVAFSVTGP